MEITMLLILIIGYGVVIYAVINLFRKNIKLEKNNSDLADFNQKAVDHMRRVSEVIKFSDKKLEEIDAKGSFKSDDEVGFFFISLQGIQSILNQFKIDYDRATGNTKSEEKT